MYEDTFIIRPTGNGYFLYDLHYAQIEITHAVQRKESLLHVGINMSTPWLNQE